MREPFIRVVGREADAKTLGRLMQAHELAQDDCLVPTWGEEVDDAVAGRTAARDLSCEPRNFLRPCLLLLLKECADHGYGLVERLKPMGVADGNPGAVYRTLRDLERAGLTRSGWKASPAGPARRVYRLTPEGEDALDAWGNALSITHRALGEYLVRHALASGQVLRTGS